MWAAHTLLLQHAACEGGGTAYDSDDSDGGRPCPCQWHPVMIEEVDDARLTVQRWPGPVCGPCWAATCACGYRFDDLEQATSQFQRDNDRRLVCASCAAGQPGSAPPAQA